MLVQCSINWVHTQRQGRKTCYLSRSFSWENYSLGIWGKILNIMLRYSFYGIVFYARQLLKFVYLFGWEIYLSYSCTSLGVWGWYVFKNYYIHSLCFLCKWCFENIYISSISCYCENSKVMLWTKHIIHIWNVYTFLFNLMYKGLRD